MGGASIRLEMLVSYSCTFYREQDMAAEAQQPREAAVPDRSLADLRPVEIGSILHLPPDFGPSSAYAQTSQARNWRYSAKTLARLRYDGNQAARRRLESIWNEEQQASSSTALASDIPFLSVDDELALITYYLVKVGQIVRAFGLPELVEGTATTYVKRFYLRNTCMDFHPKNVVITCIFLASKAENYPLNLLDFARKLAGKSGDKALIEENRKTVLDLEFLVSQSLQFEYAVVGAHRALYGLMLDIQTLAEPPSREAVHALAASSHSHLTNSRLTDAEFIYTPSQIALACLRAAEGAQASGRDLVNRWLDSKEARAKTQSLAAKAERVKERALEQERQNKAKLAAAKRAKGKAGLKAAEDAIAAAAAAAASSAPPPAVEYDDTVIELQPLGLSRTDLEKVLDEIEALFKAREAGGYTGIGKGSDDIEQVKEIDKRQKQCMNPEKVPGSKLFLKRQAEEQDIAQQKRARKAATGALVDPFANNQKSENPASGGLFGAELVKRAVTKSEVTDGNGQTVPMVIDSDDEDDAVPVSKDFGLKPEPTV